MNQNILENQINDHINDKFFDNILELEEDFTFLYDNNAINDAFAFILNSQSNANNNNIEESLKQDSDIFTKIIESEID
ncbi:17627_t:CDS:1, partial [Funneliformis geosporum]